MIREAISLAGCLLAFGTAWAQTQRVIRPEPKRTEHARKTTYVLSGQVSAYFEALAALRSIPIQATGVFSGEITNPNAASSTGDALMVEYTKHFRGLGDYGVKGDLVFSAAGPIRYRFQVPYTAEFEVPDTVFPGQRIYLAPSFSWAAPEAKLALEATQNYAYSFSNSFWFDAPDGFDATTLKYVQEATKAHIKAGLPAVPGFSSVKIDRDVTFWPFNTGGGSYTGSYTKLGGTGQLMTSDGLLAKSEAMEVGVAARGTSETAWKQGHEQFDLAAYVLSSIPVTSVAGAALKAIREIGGFRLNTQLEGSIRRQDIVYLTLAELPHLDVPADVSGGRWSFANLDVPVKFRAYAISFFGYPVDFNISFDMRGIDAKTLLDYEALELPAGSAATEWKEFQGAFKISGTIPVKPKREISAALQLDSRMAPASTAQPLRPKVTRSPIKTQGRVAGRNEMRRVIRETGDLVFPKPTAMRGRPLAGHWTVVLGVAPESTAVQICEALKRKGIEAFTAPARERGKAWVTLGSFANKNEAEVLAALLREAFKVRAWVAERIDGLSEQPIADDVLTKLRSR